MAAKKNVLYRIRVIFAVCTAILATAAFAGLVYPVKILDLQLGALIQRVFIDFSITALILILLISLITIFFGRLYCSALCPLGLLQEFAGLFKKKAAVRQKSLFIKYIIAAIVFGALAGGTAYILRLAEPYTYFGSAFSLSLIGLTAVAAIILLVFFKDRFFCTNLCPVGTVLGLMSKFSVNKIYIEKESCVLCGSCGKICPSGCINYKEKSILNETCIKCLKCLNVCPKNSIKYGINKEKTTEFSASRRKLVLSAATLAVFAAAAKAGSAIKKTVSDRFSDVILPPGALNEMRFANKCLNCNLCVKVCPSNIIKKADGNYGAVSIDYSKGFCDYTCNKCSAACPAGALKKLSLEEKQKLRIAMIAPPFENFKELKACTDACPTNALTIKNGKPAFIAMKCIGCGACAALSGGHIKIYGTMEQKAL